LPAVSLTDFIDIVASSGTPKATKVGEIKKRGEYEVFTDFWKQLREGIVRLHKDNGPIADLKRLLPNITDQKKLDNYPEAIVGYKKWIGRKSAAWFAPPKANIKSSGTEVSINPEIGLEINGVPHVVKLYFKKPKLSKAKADIATAAMELKLRRKLSENTVIGILDVRRAKLFTSKPPTPKLEALIAGELAYISALWDGL
jgi:hypothetical protein